MLPIGALVVYEELSGYPIARNLFVVLGEGKAGTDGKPRCIVQGLVPRGCYHAGISFRRPIEVRAADLSPIAAYGMTIDSISPGVGCTILQLKAEPALVPTASRPWGDPHSEYSKERLQDSAAVYDERIVDLVRRAAAVLSTSEAA